MLLCAKFDALRCDSERFLRVGGYIHRLIFLAPYNGCMIFLALILIFFTCSLLLTLSKPHPQMLHKKSPRLLARVVLVVARDKQAVIDWLVERGKIIGIVGG